MELSSRRRRAWTAAAAATVLATIGVVPAIGPAHAAETLTDIAYAPAEPAGSRGHLLDLYLPTSAAPTPLVIWSSGSAWMSDDGKSGAATVAAQLNARGYAVAGVSVRSSAQARFPAQVHDVKAAIRWLRANAEQYNLDPDRFVAMGDSSGGWLASMATLTGDVAALEGTVGTTGVSSAVQAGVDFFGPTDLLVIGSQSDGGFDHDGPTSPSAQLLGCTVASCPDRARAANPITYVDPGDPPMLVLHGQADPIVPHGQSVLLYEALKASCLDARFYSVPGAGHSHADVMSSSRYGQQTVYTTTGCQETRTTGSPDPSWGAIATFLDDVLGRGSIPAPTPTPTTTPPVTPTPTPTTTPPVDPGTAGCTAAYRVNTSWSEGFVGEVTVTAGDQALDSWTVTLTLPDGSSVTNMWNAVSSGTTGTVTARNAAWNGNIGPGGSTTFGFQGSGPGQGLVATCTAG